MLNLAPDIFRQRLLIEGFYNINVTEDVVDNYLRSLASCLDLKIYNDPIIFSSQSGMGKEENQGFDAFVPLIDSGISIYIWTKSKFFSIVIYTCKGFDENTAIEFTKDFFDSINIPEHFSF